MSFRLKIEFPRPADDDELGWHKGFYQHGLLVGAAWDDENRRQVGWVVRAGAEKYGNEVITPMGFKWRVEEYD